MKKKLFRFISAFTMLSLLASCAPEPSFPSLPTPIPPTTPTDKAQPTQEITPTKEAKPTAAALPTREIRPTSAVAPTKELVPTAAPEPTTTPEPTEPPAPTEEPRLEELPDFQPYTSPIIEKDGLATNNEYFSFRVLSMELQSETEYLLTVQIENYTDRALSFSVFNTYLHTLVCETDYDTANIDVDAGDSHTAQITVYYPQKGLPAPDTVTDFEFALEVATAEGYDYLFHDTFRYCPFGEDNALTYTFTPSENDLLLADTEEFTMWLTGFHFDTKPYTIDFHFANHDGIRIRLGLDGVVLNGVECSPYFRYSIAPGMQGYGSIEFSEKMTVMDDDPTLRELILTLTASYISSGVYVDFMDWPDEFYRETITVVPIGQ